MTYLLLISTLVGIGSCVEPFDPNIQDFESVYVIDGEINNLEGPYTVRVSQSFEYDKEAVQMVTGAQVMIMDDVGNKVTLTEVEDGLYRTSNDNFRGVPGRQYKLRIEISDDVILESDFETLNTPVEIDSLYWQYEDRAHAGVSGIEIMIDNHDKQNETSFYAWEYEEYWKYSVAYESNLYGNQYYCWDSSMLNSRILGSTAGFTENRFKQKSLYYVDNTTNRLQDHYSTLVRQYSLNEEAYQFYDQLQSLTENTGSLFDPIPYTLEGNMKYVDHPDIPVLGLFQVAGVSEKRIFIDDEELPTGFLTYDPFDDCTAVRIESPDSALIDSVENVGYTMFARIAVDAGPDLLVYASRRQCYLCTLTGSNKEPPFWEE